MNQRDCQACQEYYQLSRRGFMKLAGLSAAAAMAKGIVTPHGFQLVEVAMGKKGNLGDLAPTPDANNPASFGMLVLEGTSYEKVQKH